MSLRFRPYDRERRFVWPVPFVRRPACGRWIALHGAPPDWAPLFTKALDLMLIDAVHRDGCVVVGDHTGRVSWRGSASWTVIDLELRGMSVKKQAVVKAALLKAARYAR